MPVNADRWARLCASVIAFCLSAGGTVHAEEAGKTHTASPIKHLIIIIGENRTFDHVFGVYKPRAGQTISNLLSKGIVKEDGSPGANFAAAAQFSVPARPVYLFELSRRRRRCAGSRRPSPCGSYVIG